MSDDRHTPKAATTNSTLRPTRGAPAVPFDEPAMRQEEEASTGAIVGIIISD
jgi:hypothetical protein